MTQLEKQDEFVLIYSYEGVANNKNGAFSLKKYEMSCLPLPECTHDGGSLIQETWKDPRFLSYEFDVFESSEGSSGRWLAVALPSAFRNSHVEEVIGNVLHSISAFVHLAHTSTEKEWVMAYDGKQTWKEAWEKVQKGYGVCGEIAVWVSSLLLKSGLTDVVFITGSVGNGGRRPHASILFEVDGVGFFGTWMTVNANEGSASHEVFLVVPLYFRDNHKVVPIPGANNVVAEYPPQALIGYAAKEPRIYMTGPTDWVFRVPEGTSQTWAVNKRGNKTDFIWPHPRKTVSSIISVNSPAELLDALMDAWKNGPSSAHYEWTPSGGRLWLGYKTRPVP